MRECLAVFEELLELLAEGLLSGWVALDLLCEPRAQPSAPAWTFVLPAVVQVGDVMLEHLAQLGLMEPNVGDLLILERDGIHAVLAVEELEHLPLRVAHCAVVLDRDVLHGLDEPALDVTRLRSLHSSVDQTLATAHGVKEELLRGEPTQVRVLDKAARLGTVVVLGEVRQRAVEEAVWDALPLGGVR